MGNLNDDQRLVGGPLQLGENSGGDSRMGDGFQLVESGGCGKDDRREAGTVDTVLDHHLWPATTYGVKGLSLRLQHRMADLICMDYRYSALHEDAAHGALASSDSARQQQSDLLALIHEVTVP